MKKATLVLATAVAFLLSGPVFAARKVVDMPSTGTILSGSTSSIAENGVLKVSGAALVGEYIPGVKNALAIVPETKIASSAISGLAKKAMRGGVAGIVGGVIIGEAIDGLGWAIDQATGQVVKNTGGSVAPYNPTGSDYYWESSGQKAADPETLCQALEARVSAGYPGHSFSHSLSSEGPTSLYCQVTSDSWMGGGAYITRYGSSCPAGTSYSESKHGCVVPGYSPLSDSDYNTLDGFVQGKDGVWQRGLTTEICGNNEDCYKGLNPDTSLTGPSKVTGTPQTVTTTSPSGAVSTSVKTPTTTITYGPNYYDYSTTTTTTNNNGGDSTTVSDDTDTALPVPPDIFGGANDGIGRIRDDIPTTGSTTSPIPYMAWWSFSQSCSEITFVIPIYGAVTTALCPIYKQYIWPVLYFFFAVFTWFTCFEIWRKTAMRVRAS